MRVVAYATLRVYFESHEDAGAALREWHKEAEQAQWLTPHEIKARYPSASIIGNSRVCFNIKGNAYRLIVAVDYATGFVLIKWVGTHAEYDKIDAAAVGGGG